MLSFHVNFDGEFDEADDLLITVAGMLSIHVDFFRCNSSIILITFTGITCLRV